MKKIISFMTMLAAVTLFTACSSDTDHTPSEYYLLKVVSADVTFGPDASLGSIVVEATGDVTAVSNEDWCTVSVSGNTVSVEVTGLEDIASRNAEVTIKSGEKSVSVPVHQSGKIVVLDGESKYILDAANAETVTLANKSNCTVEEEVSDDWIHYTIAEDGTYTFTFDDNDGEYRSGSFTISSGEYSKTVYFGQWGEIEPELTGSYYAFFQEYDDNDELQWYIAPVTITTGTAANTYIIDGLCDAGSVGTIQLNHNTSTDDYYITSGYSPGTWTYGGTRYTLRCMMNYFNASGTAYVSATINSTATNAYRMSFAYDTDEKANLIFKYRKNSNLSASYTTPGFRIYAYTSTTSAAATYRQYWLYMYYNLQFYKIDDEA